MNIISSILIIFTILLSVIIFLGLIGWLRGIGNVIFPGIGIVVSLPFLLILLLVFQIVLIVITGFIKPSKNESEIYNEQIYDSENYG